VRGEERRTGREITRYRERWMGRDMVRSRSRDGQKNYKVK